VSDVAISLGLVIIAIAISRFTRLSLESELAIATIRALAQLLVLAVVIDFVFSELSLAGVFLIVMLGAAAWTSARRLKGVPRAGVVALTSIATAAGIPFLVLFGSAVFAWEPNAVIPIAGMLIGNSMATTSVAGSRMRDELLSRTNEIESRLALGDRVTQATASYRRGAAITSLIPLIDATKNVGVILLPGAFVGMVLAGASPTDAARVQLIVLFMLLAAAAIAGIMTTVLVTRAFTGPGERVVVPPGSLRQT
jgi:putative ABC transport system permease protein